MLDQQFVSLYVNITYLNCKHFKRQAIVGIPSPRSGRKLRESIAATSQPVRFLDIEFPLIEAVRSISRAGISIDDDGGCCDSAMRQLSISHHYGTLPRKLMLSELLQPEIRQACGTRELTAESGRSLHDEVKKKIRLIGSKTPVVSRDATSNRIGNVNRAHASWGEQRYRELILSPSRETRCLLIGLVSRLYLLGDRREKDL